jgi:hypothetical protein
MKRSPTTGHLSDEERFPQDPGQLSRRALEDAIDRRRAEGSDETTQRALGTIRLISGFPREVPWYGKHLPSIYGEDKTIAGTVYRNMAETLEGHAHKLTDEVYRRGAQRMAAHLRRLIERGRREYNAYLDQWWEERA